MVFYIVIYILILCIYKLFNKSYAYVGIFLLAFFLACIRGTTVGTDYQGYLHHLNSGYYDIDIKDAIDWYMTGNYSDNLRKYGSLREFGFALLMQFLKILFGSKGAVLACVFIVYFLYILSLKRIFKNNRDLNLAAFILFSIFILYAPFNTLRQSLSVSVMMLGATFLYRRRWTPGILLLAVAATIHFSAVPAAALILAGLFLKLKPKLCTILLIAAAGVYALNINIDKLVAVFPSDFGGRDISANFEERTQIYNVYVHYITLLLILANIYIFYLSYKGYKEKNVNLYMWWFIGLFLYILLVQSPNVGRFTEFLYPFMAFAIPLSTRFKVKKERRRYLDTVLLLCMMWQGIYILFNWYGLQPFVLG